MTKRTWRDTLAAAGVIASLVFVGLELRQSNAHARAAAYQSIGTATAGLFDGLAHDAELSFAWNEDPSEWEEVDWQQLAWKFTAFARLGEMVLLQIDQDVLEDDAIERLGYGGWRYFLDEPEACVWLVFRGNVSPEFRSLVEDGRDLSGLEDDCREYALPRVQPTTS